MPEIILSADKIFEIAEKIEIKGASFYRNAAEKMDAPRKRQLLIELAIMEDGHAADFAEIRRTIQVLDEGLPTIPESALLSPFLQSMTRLLISDLDTSREESKIKFDSIKDILLTAIGMEKDSIIFYLAIKDAIPTGPERNKIDVILAQEKEHLTLLNGFLGELED